MFQGAFAELALTSLVIGAPALIAVLWEKRAQKRKDVSKYSISLDADEIAHMDASDKEFSRLVDLAESNKQKRRDDQIFKTVKEFRDEL